MILGGFGRWVWRKPGFCCGLCFGLFWLGCFGVVVLGILLLLSVCSGL